MRKRILLTGATDGIGLETAKKLVSLGHKVLLHGRNAAKLSNVVQMLTSFSADEELQSYVADLSQMSDVVSLAKAVSDNNKQLDVLINNAGVFKTVQPLTPDGLDLRFVVNTIAPYLLTQKLLPLLANSGRVINLSSAAQARVDLDALTGKRSLNDSEAYAQSKLALTMWSRHLGKSFGDDGPAIIAVNPGSFLGSKMVKEAYGSEGRDLGIGASVLTRASLDDEFASASGQYFDNDSRGFSPLHPDALDDVKSNELLKTVESVLFKLLSL